MQLFNEIDIDGNVLRGPFVLGPYDTLVEGHQWVPFYISLNELKSLKKKTIESWRDIANSQPVPCIVSDTMYTWAADPTSRELLGSAVSLASLGVVPAPPVWRSIENVNVVVTLNDLKNIAAATAAQTQAAYSHSWQLKYLVDTATTEEQLNTIVW